MERAQELLIVCMYTGTQQHTIVSGMECRNKTPITRSRRKKKRSNGDRMIRLFSPCGLSAQCVTTTILWITGFKSDDSIVVCRVLCTSAHSHNFYCTWRMKKETNENERIKIIISARTFLVRCSSLISMLQFHIIVIIIIILIADDMCLVVVMVVMVLLTMFDGFIELTYPMIYSEWNSWQNE